MPTTLVVSLSVSGKETQGVSGQETQGCLSQKT